MEPYQAFGKLCEEHIHPYALLGWDIDMNIAPIRKIKKDKQTKIILRKLYKCCGKRPNYAELQWNASFVGQYLL
jgi:hypothetical protein